METIGPDARKPPAVPRGQHRHRRQRHWRITSATDATIEAGAPLPTPGRIMLITGPMFAGKTTTLVRHVRRCRARNMRCLLIGHTLDAARHGGSGAPASTLATHGGRATAKCVRLAELPDSPAAIAADYDVVAIDEGQFFANLAPFCQRLAAAGAAVVVAALDMDFRAAPFEETAALAAACDSTVQLRARCTRCGAPATRTARTGGDSAQRVVVGGSELYTPLCAPCYEREAGRDGGERVRSDPDRGTVGGVSGCHAH